VLGFVSGDGKVAVILNRLSITVQLCCIGVGGDGKCCYPDRQQVRYISVGDSKCCYPDCQQVRYISVGDGKCPRTLAHLFNP